MEDRNCEVDFRQYFEHLLKKDSPDSRRLCAVVSTMLYRFHLRQRHTVGDVLSEVFVRGLNYVGSGKKINSHGGWVRVTAYNVVREWSRASKKETMFLEEAYVVETAMADPDETDQQYRFAYQALGQLPDFERKLVDLKVMKGLSWREVRQALVESGEPDVIEATLRKRKERAVKHMRQCYFELSRD